MYNIAVLLLPFRSKDYVQMLVDPTGELIFFQCRSGPFIPTLRFLHRCALLRTAIERQGSHNPLAWRAPRVNTLRPCTDHCRCFPACARADPDILPKYQVDRGAISFVLSGANIMAPGLTSAGGKMDDVPAEAVVAIMAEGKEHALAIGITTMSTKQILSDNKGIAVENTHWLKDGLWGFQKIEVPKS